MKLQRLVLIVSMILPSVSMSAGLDGLPKMENGRILLESNDAGEKVYSDQIINEGLFQPTHHKYFHYKLSFEEVTDVITPEVEDAFDLFIFANVSYQAYGSPNDFIPSQRMRIYRKPGAGTRIFNRDVVGNILAYNPVSASAFGTSDHKPALPGLPGEILISSGAGHFGSDYVDTFSGVFRMNTHKTRTRRYQDGMIHSMYVDIKYPWGKMSGIAVHGTPKSRYRHLGKQASHGCIRVKQSVSLPLYEYVMSSDMHDPYLLDFSRSQRLPTGPLRDARPGQRVLMIFFYGYNGNQGLDI